MSFKRVFFEHEKDQLEDLAEREKALDFKNDFTEEEQEILSENLNYASAAYLDNSVTFYPSKKAAQRIEMTFYLKNNSDSSFLIKQIKQIMTGKWRIHLDFWAFAVNMRDEKKLMYPSFGTSFNSTSDITSDEKFEKLVAQLGNDLISSVYENHDVGYRSFESSGVKITRLISLWISLQKL